MSTRAWGLDLNAGGSSSGSATAQAPVFVSDVDCGCVCFAAFPSCANAMSQRLCPLDDLPELQPVAFDVEIAGDSESVLLVRHGAQVAAYLNICPHAGRRLDWAPGRFLMEGGRLICAAHGASFAIPDGLCVAGPCKGQSLRGVSVRIHGGEVWFAGD